MDTKKILHYIILACAVFILLYIITPHEDKTEKYQNVVSSNGINSINTQTQLIPQQNTTDTVQLLQTILKSEPTPTNIIPKTPELTPIVPTLSPVANNVVDMQNTPRKIKTPSATPENIMIDVTEQVEKRRTNLRDKLNGQLKYSKDYKIGRNINVEEASVDDMNKYDDYVNKFVLSGQTVVDDTIIPDVDIKKHQEEFVKFRDSVWKQSDYSENMDKFDNILNRSGSDSFDEIFAGKKINEVYGKLTDPFIFDEQKLIPPKYDNVTKHQYYISNGFGGKFIIDDEWVYDKEMSINGGEFYDSVYPTAEKERKSDKNVVF